MYKNELSNVPTTDCVAVLYVTLFKYDPMAVFLLIVKRFGLGWALFVATIEHAAVWALGILIYPDDSEANVDEQVKHWLASLATWHVSHAEWQYWVLTQLFPL